MVPYVQLDFQCFTAFQQLKWNMSRCGIVRSSRVVVCIWKAGVILRIPNLLSHLPPGPRVSLTSDGRSCCICELVLHIVGGNTGCLTNLGMWKWKFWVLTLYSMSWICRFRGVRVDMWSVVLFYLIHKRFTAVVSWIKFFSKGILFLGQQSRRSTEQIRNTAVRNKGAGEKSAKWLMMLWKSLPHQSKTCCMATLSLRILDYGGIPRCCRKSLTLRSALSSKDVGYQ